MESSPKKINFVNESKKSEDTVNSNYNQSLTSVHQERLFPLDLTYPLASSPDKYIAKFDLNQPPPDEDE